MWHYLLKPYPTFSSCLQENPSIMIMLRECLNHSACPSVHPHIRLIILPPLSATLLEPVLNFSLPPRVLFFLSLHSVKQGRETSACSWTTRHSTGRSFLPSFFRERTPKKPSFLSSLLSTKFRNQNLIRIPARLQPTVDCRS